MLTLPIKRKWFDMILSGEKTEEYREIKPYYISRFENLFGFYYIPGGSPASAKDLLIYQDYHVREIMFRNGYSATAPAFVASCTISVGRGKKKWGAEPGKKYFVLKIDAIRGEEKTNE